MRRYNIFIDRILNRQDAMEARRVDPADVRQLLLARGVRADVLQALGVEHPLERGVAGDADDADQSFVLTAGGHASGPLRDVIHAAHVGPAGRASDSTPNGSSGLAPLRQRVLNLTARGLLEMAGREDRAALSAWEARRVHWAARLTSPGHDLLLYDGVCPRPEVAAAPALEEQLVELIPSQMTALRLYVALADRLKVPPAEGLTERIRAARRAPGQNRWHLRLTRVQMGSVAYGLWLHRMTGSASEAARFERDYGITHTCTPASPHTHR